MKNAANLTFQWHWEPTMIAGRECPLAVASDPDGMLIDACERQDAGEEGVIDPFWATTWRAASGLDRFLDNYSLEGVRVLEVGCGTGHAGLAAAMRGADVTLTDGVDDPLDLVRMSVEKNGQDCTVKRLRFGQDTMEGEKFPLILGSDVTYLRVLWPQLEECFEQHLADNGEVLLSDPHRIIGNEFQTWIADRPWNYEAHKVTLDDDANHPIRVMRLTRK
ncbi:protein N-lysine methyltransferase family protein [Rubripirellula amarantea]|nr:protein N-lysine methyltransferase family protein [Rubripirellula amarantea]